MEIAGGICEGVIITDGHFVTFPNVPRVVGGHQVE